MPTITHFMLVIISLGSIISIQVGINYLNYLNLPFDILRFEPEIFSLMALEIAFHEKSHRQLCENEAIAERKLGTRVAGKLKRRLADLRAATNVKDIVVGKPRLLGGGRQQQIALELGDGYYLTFCSNHTPPPLLASGEMDWSHVSRIKILRIENHNG